MILETGQRYGSLIKLKPEYEERYIILHRHTFPAVLKRIYDSHIRNFSIFLLESMLFSYFEYIGTNYFAILFPGPSLCLYGVAALSSKNIRSTEKTPRSRN
jgi:hypothetical protein